MEHMQEITNHLPQLQVLSPLNMPLCAASKTQFSPCLSPSKDPIIFRNNSRSLNMGFHYLAATTLSKLVSSLSKPPITISVLCHHLCWAEWCSSLWPQRCHILIPCDIPSDMLLYMAEGTLLMWLRVWTLRCRDHCGLPDWPNHRST